MRVSIRSGPRLRPLWAICALFTILLLSTPAQAQIGVTLIGPGTVASGATADYEVYVFNMTPTSFPPDPAGVPGTLRFSSGLWLLGASGTNWTCAPPVGGDVTCRYFGGLPAFGVTDSLFLSFMADSQTALSSCNLVAPPCVRLEALPAPPVAGDVMETHVTGPVVTRWIDPAGGSFADPGNWSLGVPDADDTAIFDLDATYTVTLAAPTAIREIKAYDGDVTLDLGGTSASTEMLSMGNDPNPLVLYPVLRLAGSGELVAEEAELAGDDAQLSIGGGSSLRVETQLQLKGFTRIDLTAGAVAVGSGPYPAMGTLSVGADGTLIPSGQVVGNVENAGSVLLTTIFYVTPPANVTGNYVQLASGTLEIWVSTSFPPARSSALRVTGSATVDGMFRAYGDGHFAPVSVLANQTLPFLYAGSISGGPASFDNQTRVVGYPDVTVNPAVLRFLSAAVCSDGLDNDGDGAVDFPADGDCVSPYAAASEGPGACGLGVEQALLLPILYGVRAGVRRRRRGA